jgi:plastocyanin
MRTKILTVVIACMILLMSLAAYLAPSILPSVAPVKASSRTISLVGTLVGGYYSNYYWNNSNPTITVSKGDALTIKVSSADTTSHQLLIDFDNDGYTDTADCATGADQCSATVPPSTTVPFTVNYNPGTYKYYCTFHPLSMVGDFVVQPPDFGVSSNPSNLSILQGSNANSTITISSINNFAGTITLSANSFPSGPATSFGTNPVMVSSGGTATSKLTISIPQTTSPGQYSVTVTGTNSSGSPSHTTTVSVTVTKPDFSITSSPTSLTVDLSSSGTTSITLTSTNGFSGTLTLSTSVSPAGPQVSLNPTSVSLTPGGSASSTLTVSTAASGYYSTSVAQGSYTMNVTASSGSLVHSTPVSLTVGSTSSTPPSTSTLPLLPIAGVIAAIVVIGTAAFLIRRRH